MDSKLVEDIEEVFGLLQAKMHSVGLTKEECMSNDALYRCLESLRWIPVEERLPETLKEVWVKANGVIQKTVCRKTEDSWEYYNGEWNEIDDLQWPTHWLPIPQ